MSRCMHLSEFGRICELTSGHDGLHRKSYGVDGFASWPTRPWGWSKSREVYASPDMLPGA